MKRIFIAAMIMFGFVASCATVPNFKTEKEIKDLKEQVEAIQSVMIEEKMDSLMDSLMKSAEGTGADQKLTGLGTMDTFPDYNDKFYVVDTSGPTSLAILYQYLIGARTPVVGTPSGWTMTGNSMYGGTFIATGTSTKALPAVGVGMYFAVKARGDFAPTITPDGTEIIYLNGTSCTAGVGIVGSGSAGDIAIFQYSDSGVWDVDANGFTCVP